MTPFNIRIPDSVRLLRPSGSIAARVFQATRSWYQLYTEFGEQSAQLAGAFRHEAASAGQLPAVGDWVFIDNGLIRGIAPRTSKFSRQVAGTRAGEQLLAANIDTVLIVTGLDGDFNLRRMERYLVLTREGGASPVLVLSKSDLGGEELSERVDATRSIAGGAPVVLCSTRVPNGLDSLRTLLHGGRTAALFGSSGAGKSSIVNALLGEDRNRTGEVREHDSRGRHTTTHRELIPMPGGYFLIDTPGLRELQLWADEDSVEQTFPEIPELAAHCRFSDCRHSGEPGCAVVSALESGTLEESRWLSYSKLTSEVRRMDKQTLKQIHKAQRAHYKRSGRH